MAERLSKTGEVTIELDFRTSLPGIGREENGRFVDVEEFLVLLGAISAITGPGTKAFFDFGRVAITGANLEAILERLAEKGAPDA